MRKIYFGDFHQYVKSHYKEIYAQEPEYQSREWFLLKYLKRIEKNTLPEATPGQVENSMRGFIRYYVDMIDEKSPMGDRCLKVYAEYRKTLRREQEDK